MKALWYGEFIKEKEFVIENSNAKLDEHLALRSYYAGVCQREEGVDFGLVTSILRKILQMPDEGTYREGLNLFLIYKITVFVTKALSWCSCRVLSKSSPWLAI